MDTITHTDEKGRQYKAYENDGQHIIIGPPEGLVDELALPEPFATNLHNALFRRNIISYSDAAKKPQDLTGALQEVLTLDVQKLLEAFHKLAS